MLTVVFLALSIYRTLWVSKEVWINSYAAPIIENFCCSSVDSSETFSVNVSVDFLDTNVYRNISEWLQ